MPLERDTDEQHAALAAEWAAAATGAASELTTGRVWGLPELDDGDCWVDIAGAAVHQPEGDARPSGYPAPMVDHATERQEALDRYQRARGR